jgi:riboflavin transporter FmnP
MCSSYAAYLKKAADFLAKSSCEVLIFALNFRMILPAYLSTCQLSVRFQKGRVTYDLTVLLIFSSVMTSMTSLADTM